MILLVLTVFLQAGTCESSEQVLHPSPTPSESPDTEAPEPEGEDWDTLLTDDDDAPDDYELADSGPIDMPSQYWHGDQAGIDAWVASGFQNGFDKVFAPPGVDRNDSRTYPEGRWAYVAESGFAFVDGDRAKTAFSFTVENAPRLADPWSQPIPEPPMIDALVPPPDQSFILVLEHPATFSFRLFLRYDSLVLEFLGQCLRCTLDLDSQKGTLPQFVKTLPAERLAAVTTVPVLPGG